MALFSILTLFPDAVEAYLDVGMLGVARRRAKLDIRVVDFRDFARDRHRTVDDRPFGGGPGMVLKPEPIVEAVEWVEARHGPHRKIALTPDGRPFRQSIARELRTASDAEPVLFLCGRYEGFDERALEVLQFERLSIGDYVLAGGELAALVVVESIARLIPGVLNDERSAEQDSFSAEGDKALDHPHYTRPRVFRGLEVPDVLMTGDHARIDAWRRERAEERTKARALDSPKALRSPHDPPHGHVDRRGPSTT